MSSLSILRHYLQTAFRALRRHPGYAAINVLGLSVGIAVCLLITLFIRHEVSYDDFHDDSDRIYRIVSDWGDFSVPMTSWPVNTRLETDYPSVTQTYLQETGAVLRYEDRQFDNDRVFLAPPTFVDVFSLPLLRGDGETALQRPFTGVITPDAARKYFGDANPVGKTLRVDNQYDLEITGVVAAPPATSHLDYDLLLSWSTLDEALNYSTQFADRWGANGNYTYLLLPEGMSAASLEAEFPAFIQRHAGDDWNGATLSLQALTDIHLYSNHNSEIQPNGSATVLWVFGIIAVFVLLLACINFTNLATARATERATEVGVRKTMGAQRGQLIGQFLSESLMLSGVSLVLALGLASLALPVLRSVTSLPLTSGLLAKPFTVAALIGIAGLAGILAGSYPAFYLSRFQPVRVLQAQSTGRGTGARVRQGLVVLQFAVSTALIIGTMAATMQVNYLRSANLGFDQEQVVQIPMPDPSLIEQANVFTDRLSQDPSVASVSRGSERLPSQLLNGNSFGFAGTGVPQDSMPGLRFVGVDFGFFETMGVRSVAGRTFDASRPADSTAVIVNEAAYRLLAEDLPGSTTPGEAVGRAVESYGGVLFESAPLIGVVRNFNMATLHESVEPVLFFVEPSMADVFYVRVEAGASSAALDAIRATWASQFPDWPFQYQFTDDAFDQAYRAEQQLGLLFGLFAGLALFIAGIGLFGLAAFTAQQRTKEIGIRKALGAGLGGIVRLITRDFVRLVGIAIAVALPVAYFALRHWLNTFAYHVDLSFWIFAAGAAASLFIAVLTVGTQALRAAQTDPARALRSD